MYERIQVSTLEGYDDVLDIYTVDKYGNVYGANGMELKQSLNSSGYKQAKLKLKNKRRWKHCLVHRLVGLAFVIGKTSELNEIDHKDTIKTNNRCDNLQWTNRKGNMANPITQKNMEGKGGKECYVYDYLLNFIGKYDSLTNAQNAIGEAIRGLNIRTKHYYILERPNLSLIIDINRKQRIQSIVITDIETKEKFYFHSNRAARKFFDNRVNITQAIQGNWTVKGKYKVRSLNYKKLIGMLDL